MPYGYRPHHVLISPHGRRPRHRVRQVVEPSEAFVVWMIFTWHAHDNLTHAQITDKLVSARYPAPLNPATGQPVAWTAAFVRSVLRNPKYTGWQVWGHHHHGHPLPRDRWVWSDIQAHPALIPTTLYDAAQHPPRTVEPAAAASAPQRSRLRVTRKAS